MTRWQILLAVSVIAVPAAVAAAGPAPAPSANTRQARNPNEMVCENQEVLGSRLATRRVCATRSEWDDRRAQERQQIDKSQLTTTSPSGG